jgi:hypothetical protein
MSDTGSLFSNLSNDSMFFLNIDLKMCAILLFIILFSIFTMSSVAMMAPSPRPQIEMNRCVENFSNNEFYSYKNIDYSNYTSIPLTALDISNTNKSPSNLLFGGANRMITSNSSGDTFYTIDINANLYVLGGQVYDSAGGKIYDSGNQKIVQKYTVQLVNPKLNKTFPIGTLQKGGDGIYKLNYKLNLKNIPKEIGTVDNLINYNIVQIIYNATNTSGEVLQNKIVIQGTF